MDQKELFTRFPQDCILANRVLLIPPHEFRKLEKQNIHDCRTFLLVSKGYVRLRLNGVPHEMQACSFLDLLDGVTVQIDEISPGLRAYCLLPNYEFASESLKNLRPGPESYFLERLSVPILTLSEEENCILEGQMKQMENSLRRQDHHYREELVRLYFKSFMLEEGNIMLVHSKEINEKASAISKQDMVTLEFLKLVWAHFKTEHNADFYADKLCLSTKYLSRITTEKLNKTPHQIIRDELIHYAMSLLEDDRIPVQQIADTLHFADQSSFSKFFKKYMKMSPMAYRRQKEMKK